MKALREGLSIALILFLGGGYLASQLAYHQGRAPEYAAQIDTPPVRWLALVLLGAVVVVGILRKREPGDPE